MNAELKWCGYCRSWHSKPCGEGCCWSPTDPTLEQMSHKSAKVDWVEAK
jgi:hypothetical protein